MPERFRYCRYCHDLSHIMKDVRNAMIQMWTNHTNYTVIDSTLILLCTTAINLRTKLFLGLVNIGINTTKIVHFYKFKYHCVMTNNGYVVAFEVAQASKLIF
jgi:hypothetical protein